MGEFVGVGNQPEVDLAGEIGAPVARPLRQAADAQEETGRRRGAAIINAPAAGHSATHSRQPVHSADRMFTSLSTGSADGHALAHLPQSMHKASSRRMRSGLASAASPIKAPYGHR